MNIFWYIQAWCRHKHNPESSLKTLPQTLYLRLLLALDQRKENKKAVPSSMLMQYYLLELNSPDNTVTLISMGRKVSGKKVQL